MLHKAGEHSCFKYLHSECNKGENSIGGKKYDFYRPHT